IVPRKTEEKGDGTSKDQYYLAIPAAEKLEAKPEPAAEAFDYEGDVVSFIKADSSAFGMFAPQDGSTFYVNGDVVEMHIIPKNTTVYRGFYYGDIDDFDTLKENEVDVVLAEGAMDFTVSVENCGKALPIVPRKTEEKGDGTTADQYYLAIPAADKLAQKPSDQPEDPGQGGHDDDDDQPADKTIELTIDNQVKMFKVIDAKLVTKNGKTTLDVVLNGAGYHNLFKGTYDEAAAIGYKPEKWVEGELNKDEKWAFSIPVDADVSYLPIVSISESYVEKYLAGEAKIERAFFPRQFTVDAKAKTLLVEDFRLTTDLKVKDNTDLGVKAASLTTVGGPNSNEYATTLRLEADKAYTRVFVGTAAEAAKAEETQDIASIKLRWVGTYGDPDSVESLLDKDITLSVYNSKDNTWDEVKANVSEKNATITLSKSGSGKVAAETSVAGPKTSDAFTDVKSNDWYEEYAEKAAELGLMTGYAAGKDENGKDTYEFRGAVKTTRAQFCQILYAMEQKLNKKVKDAPSAGFADVAEGAWYEKAINWAVANDIAAGRATGFGVDASVTRQDMAVMVFNYAKANKKVLGDPDLSVLDKYADASDIAEYAKPAMAWLVKLGLMTGRSETSVAPTAESSRAEIAAFMVSVFEYLNK
ncbi:MAG: S-layer homology domain-containing protein, partial [Clostridia bacterium]|nr:S-layer homology domain-containing protein [Clostridia bacterium]